MRKKIQKKFLAVTLAALGLAAAGAPAQDRLTDIAVLNIALTFQSQGGSTDNGTVSIYDKPDSQKLSTKELLIKLAADEYAETNYPASTFPSGARLAVNVTNGAVVVVGRSNELLADVSDIVKFSAGTNDIVSGRVSDATGLASPKTTELIFVRLNFDDTFIAKVNNHWSFFVNGLGTVKTSDSTPNASSGSYRAIASGSVKNGAGEGQTDGTPCVVTGSIQASRNVKLVAAK